MVKGLELFRKMMRPYKDNFVIIGGTACDIQLSGTTMHPRATNDIDIIVVVERLTKEFVSAFWQFIKGGDYRIEKRLNQAGTSVYALYRFTLQDDNLSYPQKIELLSRHSVPVGQKIFDAIQNFVKDNENHIQSLADSLKADVTAVQTYLDVLRDEIFKQSQS